MNGPRSVCRHVTCNCYNLNGNFKKKNSFGKPSKWSQERCPHKNFLKEEVKALLDSMYKHNTKKCSDYQNKTQEELQVFNFFKVESEKEKLDKNPLEKFHKLKK
jgi:hypothetical protein